MVWTIFIFPYLGNFIIPTDEIIFFRGVGLNHQPDHHIITIWWDNPSHWLIFFKMVKTTNHIKSLVKTILYFSEGLSHQPDSTRSPYNHWHLMGSLPKSRGRGARAQCFGRALGHGDYAAAAAQQRGAGAVIGVFAVEARNMGRTLGLDLPSGYLTVCHHGKSPFVIGKNPGKPSQLARWCPSSWTLSWCK